MQINTQKRIEKAKVIPKDRLVRILVVREFRVRVSSKYVGNSVGESVMSKKSVGERVGIGMVGFNDGWLDGRGVGLLLGRKDGVCVGRTVGDFVGA